VLENMGKIVGKLFLFIFFLLFLPPLYAQIKLKVFDTTSNFLQQARVGEPFMLEVEITGARNSMQVPTIVGLDRFVAKRTGLYMHTVNGKSIIKYSYRVRIDQIGTYDIGPAIVTDHSKKQVSNILTVTVSDKPVTEKIATKRTERTGGKELLRLFVDNNKVVVGQKVTCALRFYYKNNAIELKQIGKPVMNGFSIKNVEGPYSGMELVNGVQYKYIEWGWHLYPLQPGEKIIPAYSADFDVRPKRTHALIGFSILFGSNFERKRVYSNAVPIQVDPLPPHDGMVQAVGDFKKIEASIKPAVVKEGEAMVLAIELEGDGDLAAIEVPKLDGLPKQLKYYESSSSIIEPTTNNKLPKKRFEFIVQGVECGEWEIAKQLFTYFDVHSRSYKILQTAPLTVTIVPRTIKTNLLKKKSKREQNGRVEVVKSIFPINGQGPWYPITQREPMKFRLFCFLSSIPFGLWFYRILWIWLTRYWYSNRSLWWRKKNAFRVARKQLKKAKNCQDVTQIYQIFVILIATSSNESIAQISSSFIKQQLHKAGFSENIIIMWNDFFTRATEYAFTAHNKNKPSSVSFFRQGEQWINRFEAMR